jgi:hypothetical protein
MQSNTLSDAARDLLRRRLAGEWVGVTEENRPLYRELMAAGLMYPVSTFLHGREGYFRPTDAACALRDQFNAPCIRPPSPGEVAAPRG